jgi:hypothetical protein
VGEPVTTFKLIALVVLIAVTGTVLQPAPAEAMEPMTVLTIVGVAIGVIIIIAVVVIANVRERQTGEAGDPVLIALEARAPEGL